jgi:hypothetical protein
MKRNFVIILGCVLLISVFISVQASALTKQDVQNVLRVELTRYLDGQQTLIGVEDLRSIFGAYKNMPQTGEVSLEGIGIAESSKEIIRTQATSGNGVVQGTLMWGRPNGAYCGDMGHAICGSRNCSETWGICSSNALLINGLKSNGDSCREGYECKSGTCNGSRCTVKPCDSNAQCESGSCSVRSLINRNKFCTGIGY